MAQEIKPWRDIAICFSVLLLALVCIWLQLDRGLWRNHLYFDGDNITLALALKSWFEGEPFRWIFSSQTFLFPEAPLYLLSYGLTQHFASALLLNAFLNFGILIFLVWLIYKKMNLRTQAQALGITLFISFTVFILSLEFVPNVNGHTIFSLIFLSTYYAGVILVALLQLWMLCWFAKNQSKACLLFALLFSMIGGLTYSSDPLYLLQFLIPMLSLGVILLGTQAFRRLGKSLTCLTLITIVFGLVLRQLSSPFYSAGVSGYVNLSRSIEALIGIGNLIVSSIAIPAYALLWATWSVLYLLQAHYFWRLLRKHKVAPSESEVLVHGYCLLAPLMTLVGVIVTGNVYTRYLLPVPIFILLGGVIALVRICTRYQIYILSAALTLAGSGFLAYQYFTNTPMSDWHAKDIACYQAYASRFNLHSVGGYWDVRYLNLFAEKGQPAYQVANDFYPLNWLSNIHDHRQSHINSVIVSHAEEPNHIHVGDVQILGEPSAKLACNQFDIYVYEAGSKASAILNERIRH